MSSSRIRDSSRKEIVMKRFKTKPKTDKKVFRNTANKVKAINLPQKAFRGGIRL